MNTPYSHIIKSMHDQTGKSLNSLLYEWNKAKREIEIDELTNPNAYSKLTDELLAKHSGDSARRDLSPLIADRFKKNVIGDETDVDSTDMESEQADEFEQAINQGIDDDQSDEFDPVGGFDEMFGSDDDTFNTMFGSNESDDETDSGSEFDDLFSESPDKESDSEPDAEDDSESDDDFDFDSLFDAD